MTDTRHAWMFVGPRLCGQCRQYRDRAVALERSGLPGKLLHNAQLRRGAERSRLERWVMRNHYVNYHEKMKNEIQNIF